MKEMWSKRYEKIFKKYLNLPKIQQKGPLDLVFSDIKTFLWHVLGYGDGFKTTQEMEK